MEKRSGSKFLGIAIILLMILVITKVSALDKACYESCASGCIDARNIHKCAAECLRECRFPPALSKPALN